MCTLEQAHLASFTFTLSRSNELTSYSNPMMIAHFNPDACEESVFREMCPLRGNSCCFDNPERFDISEESEPQKIRTCEGMKEWETFENLCEKDVVKENCPDSCGTCPCRDAGGRFENNKGNLVSCFFPRRDPIKCRNSLFKERCPGRLESHILRFHREKTIL